MDEILETPLYKELKRILIHTNLSIHVLMHEHIYNIYSILFYIYIYSKIKLKSSSMISLVYWSVSKVSLNGI